jgi:hypothetical protein
MKTESPILEGVEKYRECGCVVLCIDKISKKPDKLCRICNGTSVQVEPIRFDEVEFKGIFYCPHAEAKNADDCERICGHKEFDDCPEQFLLRLKPHLSGWKVRVKERRKHDML